MAMYIGEDCMNCGACEPQCENGAISEGDDRHIIDQNRCTECVGVAKEPKCVTVCPEESCIDRDPARVETREQLLAKYNALHAG